MSETPALPPMIYNDVLQLIGRTPLVRLNRLPEPYSATVLAKIESRNPGGSVKDRIGLAMIETAERESKINPGDTIVEPTSGNTGIGLAVVCAVKRLPALADNAGRHERGTAQTPRFARR